MERREQVFVSSTYVDLIEERRAVIQGLLEADCIPSGMELFPASDAEKWNLIKGVIGDCDYYLLIIGGRYGSVAPETDLSFTEMEYDYAVSIGKPVMAFLHGAPGSISVEKSDIEPDARIKLNAFREKVEQRMVKYWSTPQDLDGAVAKSLIQLRKSNPAEGWIRASHALTPETERDIAELRAKVSELTRQLEAAQHRPNFDAPEGLADGDEEYTLIAIMEFYREGDEHVVSYRRGVYRERIPVVTTWNDIFAHLGPTLLDEAEEAEFGTELRQLAMRGVVQQDLIPAGFDKEKSFIVESSNAKDVIVQLFALGLIEHGAKKRPVSDSGKYWKLTSHGRDRMMLLRAIRSQNDN